MSHIKVEGSNSLYRDENTSAIINKDKAAMKRAKAFKERMLTQDNEINTLREEVNDMKNILLQINERLKWQEQ
jgi:hypothetical protein|tara:strand:- start:942 stop:1160 length:219 start_codon:yes stop_codon:yes gene_type:complete